METVIYDNNTAIIGNSGTGKSFYVKYSILRDDFMSNKYIIVTPSPEYENFIEYMGGKSIKPSPDTCPIDPNSLKAHQYISINVKDFNNQPEVLQAFLQDFIGDLTKNNQWENLIVIYDECNLNEEYIKKQLQDKKENVHTWIISYSAQKALSYASLRVFFYTHNLNELETAYQLTVNDIKNIKITKTVKGDYSQAYLHFSEERGLNTIEILTPEPLTYWIATSERADLDIIKKFRENNPDLPLRDCIRILALKSEQPTSSTLKGTEKETPDIPAIFSILAAIKPKDKAYIIVAIIATIIVIATFFSANNRQHLAAIYSNSPFQTALDTKIEKKKYAALNLGTIDLNFVVGKTTKKEVISYLGDNYTSNIVSMPQEIKETIVYRESSPFAAPTITIILRNNVVVYFQRLTN